MLGGALILSQEAALQARYSRQLSPLLFVPVRHELEEQSRNCFKQLNLFCWPRREKRLCLPLPHNVLAAQQQGQLCLFVRLKRSWLGTKVGKWGTWDTGKTEPGLPECRVFPLHNCTVLTKAHSALLSSALNTQNTHGRRRRAVPPSARSQAFLPSLWAHRGFILPLLGSSISVLRALACSGGQSRAAVHKPFVGLGTTFRATLPSAECWNPVWNIFILTFCSSFDRQSLNNDAKY